MSRKKKRCVPSSFFPRDSAQAQNDIAYQIWFDYLYGLTVSSIVWDNRPSGITNSFMETVLTLNGYILFFRDEILDNFVCLPCTIGGRLNVYNIPIYRRVQAPNGYHGEFNMENSVIIFNNYTHTPSMQPIEYYARRLANADRSIDVNIDNQKTPYIIKTNRNQELTVRNIYRQYNENERAIYVADDFDIENIQIFPTVAPYTADKMETTKHSLFNDFLTWLGVENSNQDKKERLVSNEVGSNYGNVEMSRNMRVNARMESAEMIYQLFGWKMTPYFNSDLQTLINVGMNLLGEGELNEQVYNAVKMDS